MTLRCSIVAVFVYSVFASPVFARGPPHVTRWPRGTPAPTTPLTTKVYLWELMQAAKVEEGEYTTMAFQYFNDQLEHGNFPRRKYDRCYDDFMRCTLAYSLPQTVCAFKWLKGTSSDNRVLTGKWLFPPDRATEAGFIAGGTYCDIYLQNCIAGERQWRILNYGWCHMQYPDIVNTKPLDKFSDEVKDWYRPPERVLDRYEDDSGIVSKIGDYYYTSWDVVRYE